MVTDTVHRMVSLNLMSLWPLLTSTKFPWESQKSKEGINGAHDRPAPPFLC